MNIRKENIVSYIYNITEIESRNNPPSSNNTNILTGYFCHNYSLFRNELCNVTSKLILSPRIKT